MADGVRGLPHATANQGFARVWTVYPIGRGNKSGMSFDFAVPCSDEGSSMNLNGRLRLSTGPLEGDATLACSSGGSFKLSERLDFLLLCDPSTSLVPRFSITSCDSLAFSSSWRVGSGI
jgi:hypothetical protein